MADIIIEDHGSILFLRPQSRDGQEWLENNIGKDNGYQPEWPSVLVEPRYVERIIDGMMADGLNLEGLNLKGSIS